MTCINFAWKDKVKKSFAKNNNERGVEVETNEMDISQTIVLVGFVL